MKQVYLTDSEIETILNCLDFPIRFWKVKALKSHDDNLYESYSTVYSSLYILSQKLKKL